MYSTTHTWVIVGSSSYAEGGKKNLRATPNTHGVDKINVATEHRAKDVVSTEND